MKDFSTHAYVAGTAALQPNCSRYSNENERIISFPSNKREPEFYEIDFTRLYAAKHLPLAERLKARFFHIAQKSTALYDLRTAGLAGKSFGEIPRYKAIVAGLVYSLVAVCALFIAV